MATIADRIKSARSNTQGSTGSSRVVELLRPRLSPIVEQRKLDDERRKKEEQIKKSQEEAQRYAEEAQKYERRAGVLETIKNLPKDIATRIGTRVAPAVADVATRLSPMEGIRNVANAVKTTIQRPQGESALDAYKRGIFESKARPTYYERASNQVIPTGSIKETLTSPEGRGFIGAAAEAPTYLYGGAGALTEGALKLAPLATRLGTRSVKSLPEAGINTAIQTLEEGKTENIGKNFLANAILMATLPNVVGELGRKMSKVEIAKSGKLNKVIDEAEKKGIEVTDKDVADLEKAFMDGADENKIIENLNKEKEPVKREPTKLKAGEFAPIAKEIQETTGKKLTAKETLEIKDKIEQGYTKEEIIDEITTPKRTELTSKPLKEETPIQIPKEIKVYRGTTNAVRDERTIDGVISTSENKDVAKIFAGKNGKVQEFVVDPKAKIIKVEDITTALRKIKKPSEITPRDWVSYAKENGYDAIDMKSLKINIQSRHNPELKGFEDEIKILNPKILNESKSPSPIQTVKATPEIKAPKTTKPKTGESITAKKTNKSVSPIIKRLNENLYEAQKLDDKLDTTTHKKQLELVEKELENPKQAYNKVMYGNEQDGALKTSLLGTFLEKAKEKNSISEIGRIGMELARHGRRVGQEVEMIKAMIETNPTNKLIMDAVRTKYNKLKTKYGQVKTGSGEVDVIERRIKERVTKIE